MSGFDNYTVRKALAEQDRAKRVLREAIEVAQEADRKVYRALIGVDCEPRYKIVGPHRNHSYHKIGGRGGTRQIGHRDFAGQQTDEVENWEEETINRSFVLGKGFFTPRVDKKKDTGGNFRTGSENKRKRDQTHRQDLLLPAPLSDYCS